MSRGCFTPKLRSKFRRKVIKLGLTRCPNAFPNVDNSHIKSMSRRLYRLGYFELTRSVSRDLATIDRSPLQGF